MALADDIAALDAAINVAAIAGVASVTIGGQTVATKNLKELREWRDYLASQLAATKPHFGLRMTKLTPPGCG